MIESKFLKELVDKPISGEWGDDGGNIKVLRTTNFTNERIIDYSDVVVRDIPFKRVEAKKLLSGDLIIEKSGGSPKQPVGRVVYFDNSDLFLCNNFTSVLRPKRDLVFPKYLLYILFANHQYGFTGGFQNKTTGIINLQLARYIDKTKIPLPPLDQQKKIAAILDAADAYRQKTKALIEKYDELTQSLFLDMFGDPVSNPKGWDEVIFTDVLILKRGFDLPVQDRTKGEYPIMASNGILDWHNDFKVQGPGVVTGRSGTLGHVHLVESDYWPLNTALYSQNLNGNNPTFLLFLLRNFRVERFSRGAGVPTLNRNLVHAESIINVPIELQSKFAERVQAIESQKAQAQASLSQAEDLFNSLLQRAFKGELV